MDQSNNHNRNIYFPNKNYRLVLLFCKFLFQFLCGGTPLFFYGRNWRSVYLHQFLFTGLSLPGAWEFVVRAKSKFLPESSLSFFGLLRTFLLGALLLLELLFWSELLLGLRVHLKVTVHKDPNLHVTVWTVSSEA